ncbi:alpha/beta hydrolase [Pseudoalteromonas luteoviolacea]|uniref:alpha/beta hydrolase n=1 Tax=Pseudoalteromonas luteoviolacea TaxID=43657 RepID=UPI001B36A8A4|nr:alpha/beta hydrolase-fold protein [Pseudoalteromonas luteoviolacea]MBQ4836561.1 alpha/beta hydrolase [Pseudoalteromonas luteoviolacea]
MKHIAFALLCVLSLFAQASYLDYKYEHLPTEHTIQSAVLGEARKVWVILPEDYHAPENSDKQYPVVYTTDGENLQYLTGHNMWFLQRSNMLPQAILVAINTRHHRVRDLTPTVPKNGPTPEVSGQSLKLETFIKDEVIPFVDNTYRTDDFRVLSGHSLGGLFTITSLLSDQLQPLFKGYVAIDPSLWWDNSIVAKWVNDAQDTLKESVLSVYMVAAHEENIPPEHQALYLAHINAIDDTAKLLIDTDSTTIRYDITHDENHRSVLHIGIFRGLREVFKCYPTVCPKENEEDSSND